MFVTARAVGAAAGLLLAAGLAGCSSGGGPAPAPTPTLDVTTMRGALLQANEIGPTWTAPEATDDPTRLVSLCGGTASPPPQPPGGTPVTADFADEGEKGAQSLEQTALVFGDADAAGAARTLLKAAADQCPATVSVPATVDATRSEPAYTETVAVRPLSQGSWSGFVVIRHKKYEPKHPGTADVAVAVLTSRNVTLVDAYGIYRLSDASPAAGFDADWQRLVGSVVQRVG
jgi:hypothetical protein